MDGLFKTDAFLKVDSVYLFGNVEWLGIVKQDRYLSNHQTNDRSG